ncbi:MAG: hypothetical protein A4E66_00650 [Syntrophus sp. PtaB.Bin001]|nr:MAG: hypothetical protein A4E66_00650 [Syntrophus sp. PtaB.Bin001]
MRKHSLRHFCLALLLAVGLVLGSSLPTFAAPITYMEQAIGSGSLDGSSFFDRLVTITFVGDTSTVTGSAGFFTNSVGTATVSVAGVGSDTLTNAFVFVNQGWTPAAAVGFGDNMAGGSILDTLHSAFASYDLTTAIGPQTGSTFYRNDLTFATGSGTFHLDLAGDSTFTATTVPLPSALLLLGPGLVGLIGIRKRLQK